MAKKKYTAEQLIDCCMEETTIECDKCGKVNGYMGDADGGSGHFFFLGWRYTGFTIYCPDCATKHLKNQTNGKKKTR